MIFIISTDGRFLDFNQAIVDLLEYQSKEELFSLRYIQKVFILPIHWKVFKKQMNLNGFVKNFDLCKHYESLGVDFINVREMGSGTDLLSPRMWKTLIGPNLKKVFDAISVPSVNHICGSTDMIIKMMHECGADALSVDQKNNVVETRKKLGDDVLIFGNFDPYGTLVQQEDTTKKE